MTATAAGTAASHAQSAQQISAATAAKAAAIARSSEKLSELGINLRIALDGPYAVERAQRRTWVEPGELLRDPALPLPEARAWVTKRVGELTARDIANGLQPDGRHDGAESVLAFELLATGDLSLTVKSGVQFGLFAGAISNLGTDWHHTHILPEALAFRLPGCYAMTELGHGSDVHNLETTICWDGEEFVVHSPTPNATKAYIGNAARDGRMAVVFGQLMVDGQCHGIHAICVPIRDDNGPLPGVTIGDHGVKGGLLGIDNGTISFDSVRVPRQMLLDRYGGVTTAGTYHSEISSDSRRFFTMLGTLVRGRICVGAAGAIAGRRAISIATRYSLRRRQFPHPGADQDTLLLDYTYHQKRLLPAIAKAYALGFAANEEICLFGEVCATKEPTEKTRRRLEVQAAALKIAQTRFGVDATQVARETCGGAGYLAAGGITTMRSDVDIFVTFEGDNTVLSLLVAKGLLTQYQDLWRSLDTMGMVQQSAAMFGRAMMQQTPGRRLIEVFSQAAKRGEPAVRSCDWHMWMFEERERHLLETLASRLRPARKLSSEQAGHLVNRTQDHMVALAHAHVERFMYAAFMKGIAECHDESTRKMLRSVAALFALSTLYEDRGWFIEHGRMSTARARQMRVEVERLLGLLRPHALALVEGLGCHVAGLGSNLVSDEEG